MSVEIPVLQGRGMTMADQLARHARKTPDATALRFEGPAAATPSSTSG